jgi:predicted Zn-dependent protease
MKFLFLASAFLALASHLVTAADDDDVTTSQLMRDAARIIELAREGDNIEAGRQADVVFRAAARLHQEKDDTASLEMYENALRLSPWSVEHYLGYADVLKSLGRDEKAEHWVRSAFQRAEDVGTREKARKWLELPASPLLPAYSRERRLRICLVRIGQPPDWLVHRCGIGLENTLGIPVMLLDEKIALPQSNRSAFRRWVSQLRKDIKWNDPGLAQFARQHGLPSSNLSDHQVVELLEALIAEARPPEELANFRRTKLQLKESKYDEQWDVDKLLELVKAHAIESGDPDVIWLGISSKDLFTGDSNYCFGAAAGPPMCGVNSCARFMADFNQEPPNAERLCERLLKQMLSSVGTLLRVPRPIDPTCPRSYPQSLAEHDAKTLNLCPDCRTVILSNTGKAVPPLPEKIFDKPSDAK